MDWNKAKNILIFALLITNIFLVWNIYLARAPQTVDKEVLSETIAKLEENGLTVSAEIPEKYKSMAVLFVHYDDFIGSYTYDDNEKPDASDVLDAEQAKEAAVAFLKKLDIYSDTLKFIGTTKDTAIENSYKVTFQNYIDGIELEGCNTVCTIKDGAVTNMERFSLSPEAYGDNKMEIVSPAVALLKFMTDRQGAENSDTITSISLVYLLDKPYINADDTMSDTAFPNWKITTKSGTKAFIPAFKQ